MQKPPGTIEEFLVSQRLKDWPQDTITEDAEPLNFKLDASYSVEDISDHLLQSIPPHHEFFTDLEAKINEQESLLKEYYNQLFEPIALDERGHPLREKPFFAEIDRAYGESEINIMRKRKALYGIVDKERVQDCRFPGFKKTQLNELPGGLEGPPILNSIAEAQQFTPRVQRFWTKMFLSEASVAVLQDSFWWLFLDVFQPNQEQQDHLYDRIADSFMALFWSVHHSFKDIFFKTYAESLCQALLTLFYEAFPRSLSAFSDDFKNKLMNTIFQWVSGVRPPPYSWKKWNLPFIQSSGMDAVADNGASCQGVQGEPSREQSVPVGIGSCNIARGLVSGEEDSSTMGPKSAGKSDTTRQLDFTWDDLIRDAKAMKAKKQSTDGEKEGVTAIRESHYIGPGPDFHTIIFKLGAQSPLIAHYLKMHEIPHAPMGTLVQQLKHVEICNFPMPTVPTYDDVIKESQDLRKSLQKDYMEHKEKSRREIAEIEQQKVRVNRRFSRLKKEITGENRRYNALLLEKLEKISFFSDAFNKEDVADRDILNEDTN